MKISKETIYNFKDFGNYSKTTLDDEDVRSILLSAISDRLKLYQKGAKQHSKKRALFMTMLEIKNNIAKIEFFEDEEYKLEKIYWDIVNTYNGLNSFLLKKYMVE